MKRRQIQLICWKDLLPTLIMSCSRNKCLISANNTLIQIQISTLDVPSLFTLVAKVNFKNYERRQILWIEFSNHWKDLLLMIIMSCCRKKYLISSTKTLIQIQCTSLFTRVAKVNFIKLSNFLKEVFQPFERIFC